MAEVQSLDYWIESCIPALVSIELTGQFVIPVQVSDVFIQHALVGTQFRQSCFQLSSEHKRCWGHPSGTVRSGSVCQQELVPFIFPPLSFYLGYFEHFKQGSVLAFYLAIGLGPKWRRFSMLKELFEFFRYKLGCIVRLESEWIAITHKDRC